MKTDVFLICSLFVRITAMCVCFLQDQPSVLLCGPVFSKDRRDGQVNSV